MSNNLSIRWQKRRSEFNHDWLKNQYMPALAKCINLVAGKIDDRDFELNFYSRILVQWELHEDELSLLLEDFQSAMSPQLLLLSPPLSYADQSTKKWLGPLIHELWLRRYKVHDLVSRAKDAGMNLNRQYLQLKAFFIVNQDLGAAIGNTELTELLLNFRNRCQTLAKTLERFPSTVRVV